MAEHVVVGVRELDGQVQVVPRAITFALVREGTLPGRVLASRVHPDLSVALRGADGRLAQTAVVRTHNHHMSTISPTGATGAFLLERAPVGTWTLEVGLPDELHAGRARARMSVTIAPGENPPVEVGLD